MTCIHHYHTYKRLLVTRNTIPTYNKLQLTINTIPTYNIANLAHICFVKKKLVDLQHFGQDLQHTVHSLSRLSIMNERRMD